MIGTGTNARRMQRQHAPRETPPGGLTGGFGKFPHQIHGQQVFQDGRKVNGPRGNGKGIGGFGMIEHRSEIGIVQGHFGNVAQTGQEGCVGFERTGQCGTRHGKGTGKTQSHQTRCPAGIDITAAVVFRRRRRSVALCHGLFKTKDLPRRETGGRRNKMRRVPNKTTVLYPQATKYGSVSSIKPRIGRRISSCLLPHCHHGFRDSTTTID
eukprot:scaffold34690_cov288-Amphora_coffeaeformis.AAC.6